MNRLFHNLIAQPWAPSQYPKRRLFVRSRKVSKPRDWYFKLSYRFEIWQAHRQYCCRSACQVSERSDNSKYKSRGSLPHVSSDGCGRNCQRPLAKNNISQRPHEFTMHSALPQMQCTGGILQVVFSLANHTIGNNSQLEVMMSHTLLTAFFGNRLVLCKSLFDHTYILLPHKCFNFLVHLIEVENLDENKTEVHVHQVRGVEHWPCQVRPGLFLITSQQRRHQANFSGTTKKTWHHH